MDYQYETRDGARDFHKQRKAFIILNHVIEFLPEGSTMSHFEYCLSKGIEKEAFNKITRGFFINGAVVFYKNNFNYDDDVINEALKYIEEISYTVNSTRFEIYFGELPEQGFVYDYHYGKYENGKVLKNKTKSK